MELKNIRTRDDLIEYLSETYTSEELTNSSVNAAGVHVADWFVAVTNAKLIIDHSPVVDLAYVLLDGFDAIRSNDEAHANFFNTIFEDVDYLRKEEDYDAANKLEVDAVNELNKMLVAHFGR